MGQLCNDFQTNEVGNQNKSSDDNVLQKSFNKKQSKTEKKSGYKLAFDLLKGDIILKC